MIGYGHQDPSKCFGSQYLFNLDQGLFKLWINYVLICKTILLDLKAKVDDQQ